MFSCARGHSYDVARAGYVTLLQPQDRKSREAGDRKEAVDARARLLGAGVGRTLLDRIVERLQPVAADMSVVIDLGSGSGEAVAAIAETYGMTGVGIDLSIAAAEHAARRYPGLTWVVANADRRIPMLDRSVDLVLSLHGRRNPEECTRILTRSGHLIVALPAPDDLVELREAVQGEGVARDRSETVVAEHASHFAVVDQFDVRERHHLDQAALGDLLRGTYRGGRRAAANRAASLTALDVTVASQVILFSRK